MNKKLSNYRQSTFNKLFINNHSTEKGKVTEAIKRCRRSRRNGNRYRCYEHWCKECSRYKTEQVISETLSFAQGELDTPAFATVLVKFIKSPSNSACKREMNKAIKSIKDADITGIWFPEIAFKADKLKQIDEAVLGLSDKKRYLVHLHGIMSLRDKATLKAMFPIPEQAHVTQIGIGNYSVMSMEKNIENVVRYSTKKDWKASDIAVIEANANGFGVRRT